MHEEVAAVCHNGGFLGVSPAQDVASPDAADLDLDLVKLKSGPKGRQRRP